METPPQKNEFESKINTPKNFIEVYPLFSYDEITKLLIHQQVEIEFDIRQKTPLRHELPRLKQGQIFHYIQEQGQILKIKIINLVLDPNSEIDKVIMKGKATFKIIN